MYHYLSMNLSMSKPAAFTWGSATIFHVYQWKNYWKHNFYCLLVQINWDSCKQENLFSVCLLVKSSLNRQAFLTSVFDQPLSEIPLLFQYGFQVPVHILQNLTLFPYKIKLQSWTYCPVKKKEQKFSWRQKGKYWFIAVDSLHSREINQNGFSWSTYDLVSARTQSHNTYFLEIDTIVLHYLQF